MDVNTRETPESVKPLDVTELSSTRMSTPTWDADQIPNVGEGTSFPSLSNNASSDPKGDQIDNQSGEDEEQASAKVFARSSSPTAGAQRNKSAGYQKVGEDGVCKMHKFSLYETASRFFLVGGDLTDRKFRILKIDRSSEAGELNINEDDIVYTKKEMNALLNAVDDGNKSSGGLRLKCSTWGLLGFIRFTGAYYMLIITKRSQVAIIGGHYVYQVDSTDLITLAPSNSSRIKGLDTEEGRFVSILNNLDLSRSFYFSYSYDITRTLQKNVVREREELQHPHAIHEVDYHNSMFVWNHHLLQPASAVMKKTYDWCLPIVHGFVDQATLSVFGRTIYITIIARRSRLFAGARFLKRGANDLGYVANDVETEQIVSEMLTTSFHAPGPELFSNPNYTSYVQHRGSIPLFWTQDNSGVSPKPDIEMNLIDPFYTAAALHFDNLFDRYGAPIYVLNLIKARERVPRESILLHEYTNAITYLNMFLPDDKKIRYKAWDMSRASKSRDQDVIGVLETVAEDVLTSTGFFHNGGHKFGEPRMQNGVARTNCIDCLDRTNAAQFVIGKRALGHQLHALGILDKTNIEFDTDAVNLLTHMYHDHGDTIAIQYGGSHLVNTMETYRKINQWTSHSRDMVESFKRYYNNSFLDKQRQEAYNLFLGNYVYVSGQPMLWDLTTDYYLHHTDPRAWSGKNRKTYLKPFTTEHLTERRMPEATHASGDLANKTLSYFDDYWLEYYRPLALSSFSKIFSYKMNSTLRYVPFKSTQGDKKYDLSPFRIRDQHGGSPEKNLSKKGVVFRDLDEDSITSSNTPSISTLALTAGVLPGIANAKSPKTKQAPSSPQPTIINDDRPKASPTPTLPTVAINTPDKGQKTPKDKSAATQWTLSQFVTNSLNPTVAAKEAYDYERYISHPLNIPLVVSSETPPNASLEYVKYVNGVSTSSFASSFGDVATVSEGGDTTATITQREEEDLAEFREFLEVGDEPLTVTEVDTAKKRYKVYRQWLKGKSLFKQRADA